MLVHYSEILEVLFIFYLLGGISSLLAYFKFKSIFENASKNNPFDRRNHSPIPAVLPESNPGAGNAGKVMVSDS